MRNSITNCDIETNDLAWIQKMVAGPENIDGLEWVDEDELTGEEQMTEAPKDTSDWEMQPAENTEPDTGEKIK